MGNSYILDIIGSFSTFGLLMLAALRLNTGASENSFAYNQNYLLQRNMVVLTVMLEQDINHVGVQSGDPYGGIAYADSNDFQFYGDVTNDGIPDSVEWRVGKPSELPETQNIRDCYVYRRVNGVTTKMNLGVTQFKFRYWKIIDPTDSVVPLPIVHPTAATYSATGVSTGNIGPIDVSIMLESPYRLKQEYTQSNDTSDYQMVWRQLRSVSRNTSIQFQ
jgi:hypothetical protein